MEASAAYAASLLRTYREATAQLATSRQHRRGRARVRVLGGPPCGPRHGPRRRVGRATADHPPAEAGALRLGRCVSGFGRRIRARYVARRCVRMTGPTRRARRRQASRPSRSAFSPTPLLDEPGSTRLVERGASGPARHQRARRTTNLRRNLPREAQLCGHPRSGMACKG